MLRTRSQADTNLFITLDIRAKMCISFFMNKMLFHDTLLIISHINLLLFIGIIFIKFVTMMVICSTHEHDVADNK